MNIGYVDSWNFLFWFVQWIYWYCITFLRDFIRFLPDSFHRSWKLALPHYVKLAWIPCLRFLHTADNPRIPGFLFHKAPKFGHWFRIYCVVVYYGHSSFNIVLPMRVWTVFIRSNVVMLFHDKHYSIIDLAAKYHHEKLLVDHNLELKLRFTVQCYSRDKTHMFNKLLLRIIFITREPSIPKYKPNFFSRWKL